ncbi:DNA-processing protein DprA [Rubricoccus marinus]|uniref:DNA protecting protein DprA n=1 Tax=Rubricoccus marinus TaxID=716817 RepID=A0A259TXP9_9BACT|nr:DNA-processing protein DprA [Rubricoccus marinus]OZC02481.1 DNA protecting protein DprA [Rubricoccus marinus]
MNLFANPDSELDERRALIALAAVPGVGSGRARALLSALGSAAEVFASPEARLARVDGIGKGTARAIARADPWAYADAQLATAEKLGATLLTLADDGYPERLRQIYDPPPFLWVRGEITPEDARAVAVVGTRKASDEGRRAAHRLGRELSDAGVTVVSGLAYGIDIEAHRGALASGGRTIAVLGSGVDRIYPSRHANTVRQILEEGRGAVVSELSLGTKPDAGNFPRRNRIIAGLSVATVVAEARVSGGALLTAMMALEQNREVFAFPVSIFSEAQGTNRLIQRGFAALATSAADILEDLAPLLPASGAALGAAEASGANGATPAPEAPPDLTAGERKLFNALRTEPRHLDTICAETGVDTSTALVYLLKLEFRGLVRQLAGKQFYRG